MGHNLSFFSICNVQSCYFVYLGPIMFNVAKLPSPLFFIAREGTGTCKHVSVIYVVFAYDLVTIEKHLELVILIGIYD